MTTETYTYDLARDLKAMRQQRDELAAALRELVEAEEEYGDQTNVAVNQAWLKAKDLLAKVAP